MLHEYVQVIVANAPPIPRDAREQIAALLRPFSSEPKPAQTRSGLQNYCGDVVEETADVKYRDPDEA